MVLVGYSLIDIGLGTLYATLGLLVLSIAYKRLLKKLNKGAISGDDYCVLYALENDPVSGEVEFYFTSEKEREFKLLILDESMVDLTIVAERIASPGGNIVKFNTTTLKNGDYYFCLKTVNQKTMKKMHVLNA